MNYIYRFSPCRTVNAVCQSCENQSVNVV